MQNNSHTGMVLACMYVLLDLNGGHVLTLLFLIWVYLESVVMKGHHGDAILMLKLVGRLSL